MHIEAKQMYRGMLEAYAKVYRQENPDRYEALQKDSAPLLRMQHGHNLIISKIRLQAWHERGGSLSNIQQKDIYQELHRHYLSRHGDTLAALCVLRQYEVRAHTFFVEKLPAEDVQQLARERLLTRAVVPHYGTLYDLIFHPAEAREIFEASIYGRYGSVTKQHIEREMVHVLEAYLKTHPPNYLAVYEQLERQNQEHILQQLLTNSTLQNCALSQFETEHISNALRYVHKVSRFDSSRAQEMLGMVVRDTAIQDIGSEIARHSFQDIELLLHMLHEIDAGVAHKVVLALDKQHLVQRAARGNLQRLYWLLRALQKISPSSGAAFLDVLTPAGLAELCLAKQVKIGDIGQFRKVLAKPHWKLFLRQFTAGDLANICARSPLGTVGTFFQYEYHALPQTYEQFQQQFLREKLMSESLDEIGEFLHRIQEVPGQGKMLARKVLDDLLTVELEERIAHSDLRQFALLLYNASTVDQVYPPQLLLKVNRLEIIQSALKHSGLHGIQRFIHNVANVHKDYLPTIQQGLTSSDLTNTLAEADIRDIAHFLWNVYAYIDQEIAQAYCVLVDGQTRLAQLEQASLDDLWLFLWNITSIFNHKWIMGVRSRSCCMFCFPFSASLVYKRIYLMHSYFFDDFFLTWSKLIENWQETPSLSYGEECQSPFLVVRSASQADLLSLRPGDDEGNIDGRLW